MENMTQQQVQQIDSKHIEHDGYLAQATLLHIKCKDFYPVTFINIEVHKNAMATKDKEIEQLKDALATTAKETKPERDNK